MKCIVIFSAAMLLMVDTSTAMMIEGEQMSIDDAIIKAYSNGSMSKVYEIMQDEDTVMVELDMLFKMDTYTEMAKEMVPLGKDEGKRMKRKAIRPVRYRWTNQRVPYEIASDFSSSDRRIIFSAIADYHKYTCLRFIPASSSNRNRVRFQNGGGCSSYVGMIGGRQPISLARGCRYKGIVIHEIGHAIGFQHEQTRPDRDTFVSIQSGNIQSGVAYNFMRYSNNQVDNRNVPYDYTSVMHYSQYAFSRNGRPTIVARNRAYQNAMGNREGFSYRDIQLANAIYNCPQVNRCAARTCSKGFQGPDCKCWCDSGNRRNPIKECDGSTVTSSPVEKTTLAPVTRPMKCANKNQYCARWAGSGYCTVQRFEAYMTKNCAYSCNKCSMTTMPTVTEPTSSCIDENKYCKYWAGRGQCQRNPSYMLTNCKKSCNSCTGGERMCEDMNSNCPSWTRYCDNPSYRRYLQANCRKSCGACKTGDVTRAPDTTQPPARSGKCTDKKSFSYCTRMKNQRKCGTLLADRRCKMTCKKCN